MNCIIDRGNTKTKLHLFENEIEIACFSFFNNEDSKLQSKLNSLNFKKGILSSSSDIPDFLKKEEFIFLNTKTNLPIQINYKSPNTLGTDRIALAVGATALYPKQNCLIVSAGTCITTDLIDKNNIYQGGLISPGLTMRLQALHTFTQKLPLLKNSKKNEFPLIGKSTQESIESGVYNGIVAETKQIISQFQALYQDLTVIITGGDAFLFDLNIKNKIFAQLNLQAVGLNRILLYNAE